MLPALVLTITTDFPMLLGLCLCGNQPVSDAVASVARGALNVDFYAAAAYLCGCVGKFVR